VSLAEWTPRNPFSVPDRGEQRLLPLRAHGRGLVSAGLSQIPSREEECVVLSQVAVEDVPILRSDAGPTLSPGRFLVALKATKLRTVRRLAASLSLSRASGSGVGRP
jgi:hypothetical protein